MKAKKHIHLALFFFLLLLFCWQLVQAPWFLAVKEIEVENIASLSPWEVEQMAGVHRGSSMLKVDLKQVQARLEGSPHILAAEVKRRWPGTLAIRVQENVGVAAIPYFNSWLAVNFEGRVLSVCSQFSSLNLPIITGLDVPVVSVGDLMTDTRRWEIASGCLSLLPLSLEGQISEVNVADPHSIVLYVRDPVRIIVGDANNLEQKFQALAVMLDSIRAEYKKDLQKGRIDVSSGRAVYIKDS